jgi:hypothetical protein
LKQYRNTQLTASAKPDSAITKMSTNTSTAPIYNLTATYISTTNAPFTSTHALPIPSSTSTADRVAYLSSLRKATASLQETINSELTRRMEEDKATVEGGKAKADRDEGKDEEDYGEEVVDEEG